MPDAARGMKPSDFATRFQTSASGRQAHVRLWRGIAWRVIAAQEHVIADALAELHAGQKRSHWMWFVFPQLRRLGASPTAQRYGLVDLAEARAYLANPLLGRRIFACTDIVHSIERPTLHQIFSSPDDMKFISTMTLFALADDAQSAFRAAIDRFGGGQLDARTVDLLST